MSKKSMLFYSVLTLFASSAVVTLLGVSQVIPVKDEHLNWLLATLIGQVVVAVSALFKGTQFFDEPDAKNDQSDPSGDNEEALQVVTPKIGNPPIKITKKDEKEFLAEYQQWDILESLVAGKQTRELHRVYEFKTFEAAFEFMRLASEKILSKQDHHPRWENTYNRVEIWLSTFNLGRQLSGKDLKQARSLEELWISFDRGL